MNKNIIRLTEGDLHRIVKESVKRIIREFGDNAINSDSIGKEGYDEDEETNQFYDELGLKRPTRKFRTEYFY